ncbi:radical SAM protein [Acidobacteriota bacterium]
MNFILNRANIRHAGKSTLTYAGCLISALVTHKPSPLIAALYLTHRCNLHCTYCNFPEMETPELSTEEWRSVIDKLGDLGCRRIAILGGEPLLRRDLAEIIAHVRMRQMSCILTSNGLLVSEYITCLSQLNTLVLSLDAAGAENDEVRGEGVWRAVNEAITAAKKLGIPVKINAVLSAKTSSKLENLLSFIDRHELHITINIMRSGNPDLWRDAASIKDRDEAMRQVLLKIAHMTKVNPRILFSELSYRYAAQWDDFSKDRYEAHELSPDDPLVHYGPKCQAGRFYLTILADGATSPCINTIGQIQGGNVLHEGVETAWRNLQGHSCQTCYTPCLVEQNFLFSLKPRVLLNFISRHLIRGNFA